MATETRPDAAIAQDVLEILRYDRRIIAQGLTVDVTAGRVVLRGRVLTERQRQLCTQLAERIKGVKSLTNLLDTGPLREPTDSELEAAVRQALASAPDLPTDRIHAAVAHGIVYLTGLVGTFDQRAQAEEACWSVEGVRGVVNDIIVEPAPRTDEEIAADVRATLAWDERIDDTDLVVEVRDGVVILSGSVPTYGAKTAAAEDAWRIKGVRQVINNLEVKQAAPRSDQDIAADFLNALRNDPRVDEKRVIIHVAGGVVTLTGTVGSLVEKHAASEDAWTVPGVVDVVNQLEVIPGLQRPAAEILADVRDALTRDVRISDPTRISVIVEEGGHVILRGKVSSPAEREAAGDDAWFTAGVTRVTNELVVEGW